MASEINYKDIIYPSKIASSEYGFDNAAFIVFTPKEVAYINANDEYNYQTESAKKEVRDRIEKTKKILYARDLVTKDDEIIRSITLPINKISDSLKSNYKLMNGLDLLASGQYASWGATNIPRLLKMGGNLIGSLPLGGFAGKAIGGVGSVLANLPDEWKALGRSVFANGYMENPHDMMIYDGVERRSFAITYNFMKPQNRDEEEDLKLIRKIFRSTQIGNYKENIWSVSAPTSWYVAFYSRPLDNGLDWSHTPPPFLTYNNCGLVNSTFNFGDQSQDINFSRMESGEPIFDMSLSFLELEKMGTTSWDKNLEISQNNEG